MLAALSITLASMGRWPPANAQEATIYLNALITEVLLLFVVLIADIWALGRRRPRR